MPDNPLNSIKPFWHYQFIPPLEALPPATSQSPPPSNALETNHPLDSVGNRKADGTRGMRGPCLSCFQHRYMIPPRRRGMPKLGVPHVQSQRCRDTVRKWAAAHQRQEKAQQPQAPGVDDKTANLACTRAHVASIKAAAQSTNGQQVHNIATLRVYCKR